MLTDSYASPILVLSMINTRSILAWLVFATSTAFLSVPARAGWHVVGQIGGPVSAVAVRGTTAYVAVGLRLYVYDVSDPGAPRDVGSTKPFGDFISDIELAGSRAYVTAGKDGLHILDVSDPAIPRDIGRWDSPGSAEGVAVAGSIAYLADGPFGVQIVDVSDPAAPRGLSTAFDKFFTFDVIVDGPIAYVAAAGAGVLVLDARDRSQPRELPIVDTPGYARGLAISSTTLYVADEWGGVRIMDVATPAQPREIGAIPVQSWAFAVTVSESAVYVAAGSEGLHVYDLAHPEHRRLAVFDAPPFNLSWKVALLGDRVFLGIRAEGVTIIDVRNPSGPQPLGEISPLTNAQGVATRGNFAFVASASQGMRVVDFTNVQRPRERGRGDDDPSGAIAATGNRAYTCGVGLRVYDTSDPDRPALLGIERASEGGRDLVARGTSLYLASETELQIWDVSNPAAPIKSSRLSFPVGGLDRTAGVEGLDVVGSMAFVDRERGVSAVDVSDPRNPILLGSLATDSLTSDVCAVDQYVYAVTAGGGLSELYVIDASDPRQLVLVGKTSIPAVGVRVVVHDKKAYVAMGAAGVAVVDVSVPSAPVLTERISVPGFAKELTFASGRLVVASSDGGLVVVEETAAPPAVLSMPLDASAGGVAPSPSPPRLRSRSIPLVPAVIAARLPRVSPVAAHTVVVTSTDDSGPGTLRAALLGLQAEDTITFDPAIFPPNAPATIRTQTRLPVILVDGVTLDASNAGVILDGSALSGQFEPGIEIVSRGNTIKGLQIFNFPYAGIRLGGKGGNMIGGDRSRGKGPSGEGNVISRNKEVGIEVINPNQNRVVGNLIGTDITGRQALGRQWRGVHIFHRPGTGTDTAPDRIGGSEPWEANVIAGNEGAEVHLQGGGGNSVIGNFVGTDPTGSMRVGASANGVAISTAGNVIAGNVVAGNQHGMFVIDPGSHCNLIANNWIGVTKDGVLLTNDPYTPAVAVYEPFNAVVGNIIGGTVSITNFRGNPTETVIIGNTIGTTPLPNSPPGQQAGVRIDSAWRTFIGGATPEERNVIGGKTVGIWIKTPGLDRTFIMGNTIQDTIVGVDAGSASSSVIQGNTITRNQRGVLISAPTNRLRENSIYANGIAITIDGDGVPPPPVIAEVTLNTVRGTSCARCVVEIYSDAGMQGRWYEGSVRSDAAGSFSFATAATLRGPNLTATATDAEASTSALSAAVARPPAGTRRRAVRH